MKNPLYLLRKYENSSMNLCWQKICSIRDCASATTLRTGDVDYKARNRRGNKDRNAGSDTQGWAIKEYVMTTEHEEERESISLAEIIPVQYSDPVAVRIQSSGEYRLLWAILE